MESAVLVHARQGLARVLTLFALVAALIVGPAIVAPTFTSAAEATVYSSCTISGCTAARTARSGWSDRGFPTGRGWYTWGSQYNFAGGQFYNREGQLPSGATYYEYDVYPRANGAARDAHRIVINRSSGVTWYSPNHYTDFYRL
ncbi:ribonuclease domain-containing protein [Catenuloplanes japonicus]|uniref:ribonuclease domain-containing protein n=1 Tax=Catenuloplanes japonicus TaxID=33876 RepID=UPI0005276909|nr:ribonuclease domain-containing protein [Catenuloplanes japonicus]